MNHWDIKMACSDIPVRHIRVQFIYAEDCDHCKDMLKAVTCCLEAAGLKQIPHVFEQHLYDTDIALDLAVEYDLTDLPALVIVDSESSTSFKTFIGDDYTADSIMGAIVKMWETK